METVYAWLVVNGFIDSEKFRQIFAWLTEAAKKQGCTLEIKTNTQLLPELVIGEKNMLENRGLRESVMGEQDMWQDCGLRESVMGEQDMLEGCGLRESVMGEQDMLEGCGLRESVMGEKKFLWGGKLPRFVLFWDKDVRLARLLEKLGLRLFNRADSIEICDDKARTYLELLDRGIRMPKTVIAPKTFRMEGYPNLDFLPRVEQRLGYPMVVKECYGSFGQQVWLVHEREELLECLRGIKNRPFLFQEFIASSKGHDIRIQMVGKRAVAAMRRYHPDDFRANITNGGSMEPYEPDAAQLDMARQVMEALGLDFAGVDILFGESGEPVLCEVNSNAHFVNIWKCTGVNVADEILRHCLGRS